MYQLDMTSKAGKSLNARQLKPTVNEKQRKPMYCLPLRFKKGKLLLLVSSNYLNLLGGGSRNIVKRNLLQRPSVAIATI